MKFNDVVKEGLKGISPKGHKYRVSGISKIPSSKKWDNKKRDSIYEWYIYLTFPERKQRVRLKTNYKDIVVENLTEAKYQELEGAESDCNVDEEITKILNYR